MFSPRNYAGNNTSIVGTTCLVGCTAETVLDFLASEVEFWQQNVVF